MADSGERRGAESQDARRAGGSSRCNGRSRRRLMAACSRWNARLVIPARLRTVITVDQVREPFRFSARRPQSQVGASASSTASMNEMARGAECAFENFGRGAAARAVPACQSRAGASPRHHPVAVPQASAAAVDRGTDGQGGCRGRWARSHCAPRSARPPLLPRQRRACADCCWRARPGRSQKIAGLLEAMPPQTDMRQLHALSDQIAGTDRTSFTVLVDAIDRWLSQRLRAETVDLPRLAKVSEVWEKISRSAGRRNRSILTENRSCFRRSTSRRGGALTRLFRLMGTMLLVQMSQSMRRHFASM